MIERYFKYFLTFIVIGLGIINFSSAVLQSSGYGYVGDIDIPFTEGLYSYNITNSLNFTTSLGNSNKNMFYWYRDSNAVKYQAYFWYNNYLYTVVGNDDGITDQGYVQNWCITPNFPGVVNGVSACDGNFNYTLQDILEINPNFQTFFIENKGSADVHYGVGALMLCFNDGSNYYCVACTPYAGYCPSGITTGNVVNIPNAKFSSFYNVPFGRSPFSNDTVINNPVEGEVSNLYGDTIYQSCTNGQALQYMRNKYGYKDVMCYGGLDSFDLYSGDNYTVVPGSGLTVFDMYNYSSGYYSSFVDWFNSYDYIYTSSLGLYGNTNIPLLDNPAVFTTYFDILYNYDVPLGAKDVLSYCDLLLKQDLNGNLLDNVNIGSYIKQEVCKRNVSDNTINQSGNIVGEDLSGIGNIENVNNSGQVVSGKNIVDGTNFINSYINLLKQNYSIDKNNNVGGVLPGYIVGFLLVIILFRFLRK